MLDGGCRLDLAVDDAVVVEIKAVDRLLPIHQAQLLTYLRLSELRAGLLVNFHSAVIKNDLPRLTLSQTSGFPRYCESPKMARRVAASRCRPDLSC